MCRLYARQLSTLKPQLDHHNVRLIGIGLEELGVEEYVQGKFFAGELYIDGKKESYKSLGFKKVGCCGLLPAIAGSKARRQLSKAKAEGIKINFKGDGLQNGGLLIVTAGGKDVLLHFVQDAPAEHIDLEEILKALNIQEEVPKQDTASSKGQVECNDDVCQIKK